MSEWLIILCYCIMAYGASNIIVFGSGPFRIFEYIRGIANYINEHLGLMFSCMMCLPANLGIALSLFNWFAVPAVAFTPFNIFLAGTGMWWLAALLDGTFTSGIVWAIHQVITYFENKSQSSTLTEQNIEAEKPIEADDITKKN